MFDILSGESAEANIRWSSRSVLSLFGTQYSSLFVISSPFHSTEVQNVIFSVCAMHMHFLNKLPEYVLAIQCVLNRGSQLHFGLFSTLGLCKIQLWILLVFLQHSEFSSHSVSE